MNLHNIAGPYIRDVLDYLQARYGWQWEVTPDGTSVRFRTEGDRDWTSLGHDETANYAEDARLWIARGRPSFR